MILTKLSELTIHRQDPDITPKARRTIPRTSSAGLFLKSELHRRSSEIDQTRYSVRDSHHSIHPPTHYNPYLSSPERIKDRSPKIPERRPSKSKNFILRALGGRSSEESKPIDRVNSKASRNTLIRRLSRSKTLASSQSFRSSITSDMASSTELEDLDIADVNLNTPLYHGISTSPLSPPSPPREVAAQDMLVLSPKIVITPEANSLPTAACSFWVAIEVTGTLHPADGRNRTHPSVRRCSSQSTNAHLAGMSTLTQHSIQGLTTSRFEALRSIVLNGCRSRSWRWLSH